MSPTKPSGGDDRKLVVNDFRGHGSVGGSDFFDALPAGVTFSQGTLTGVPTQAGTFPIAVTATDGDNCAISAQYQLVVTTDTDGGSGNANRSSGCGCGTDGVPLGLSAMVLALLVQSRHRARALLRRSSKN